MLPIEYTEYPTYEEGVFRMRKDNQTILFHTADRSMKTTDYSYYQREENGSIRVEKIENGKTVCAYLDENENMLTGYKEYSLYNYDNGLFVGVKSGEYPPGVVPPNDYMKKIALLDKDGNNLTGFKYSNVSNNSVGEAVKGYQVFFKDYYGAATLVNQNGAEVLPSVFDNITLTKDGYAFVTIKDANTGENARVGYFKIPESFAEKNGSRPITVYLNGTELYFETEPFIKEQKTVVPMRKIFESLGAAVQWDNATKTVTAVSGEKTVKLTIGNEYAQVNGEDVKLELKPFIENGSTFVPLRFVSENLGAQVEWDNALRRVNITGK